MQQANNQFISNNTSKRIGSIDSLRAFALFGIILVHTLPQFGCGTLDTLQTSLDTSIHHGIDLIFSNRSARIFNILFGISFYLILRKPSYSGSKFVWRCFLLTLVGLAAKLFYWPDALMCYGLMGMMLVPIRKLTNKQIAFITAGLFILNFVISQLKFNTYLTPYIDNGLAIRYDEQSSMAEAFALWPKGVLWYFSVMLKSGFFGTLANFSLGYLIGRLGWIEKMDESVKIKHVLGVFAVYAISFYLFKHAHFHRYIMYWLRFTMIVSGAFFYSMLVVWLYNNTRLRSFLKYFEAYGKCGLTNYTMQGVIGVLVFCHFGVAFLNIRFTYIIIGVIGFYLLQAIFSHIWLNHFKNGPMEYLWRCATDRKWLPFKNTKES